MKKYLYLKFAKLILSLQLLICCVVALMGLGVIGNNASFALVIASGVAAFILYIVYEITTVVFHNAESNAQAVELLKEISRKLDRE